MKAFCKTFNLFSRCLLPSNNHYVLLPRYVNSIVRPRDTQIEYLKSALDENVSNWETVKNNILCMQGTITMKNIDAIILKYILTRKKFDCAQSFANYLQMSGNEINLGATNSILQFYYEYSRINSLTDEAKKFVMDSYRKLYDKYKVLDYQTSEKLLLALCVMDEWELSLKILDDMQLTTTPSHASYSVLIETLFRNKKKTEALELVKRSLNDGRPLLDYAYDEWIKYVLQEQKDRNAPEINLDEILLHLAQNYIKISEKTAKIISDVYTSLGWSVKYTSVKRAGGQCLCCHQKLGNIKLSKEEFLKLQQNVKDKLIVGSDLFLKTSPLELERFLKFFDKTGPYDVVLDGLNIAYSTGKGTFWEKVNAISMVVDHFYNQDRKILMLGRNHMLKWKSPVLKKISLKSFTFFTEDISQDDPYSITAAILSGAHTDIVSRDMFRGHRFLMKQEELRLLFQRWQWKHQWMIHTVKKKPVLQAPLTFTPCAQKNASGWHIPYERIVENEDYSSTVDPYCSAWLCIKKKPNS